MILEVPSQDTEPWPSLGGYVCDWIEKNLVFGPGDLLGQPAKLDDEKRYLIWRAYEVYPQGDEQAGRRRFKRVTFSLRKGSAKTEFMAWIVAAELARDGPVRCDGFRKDGSMIVRPVRNPYIPLCAYTEAQTEELAYGALREILLRSKIADQFDIGLGRIVRVGKNGAADGKAVAVASAPNARDGARTTMQGFDETHRFTLPALRKAHQTMLQNIPKRRMSDAWSLETTTAYLPGENSVAEATHNYARAVDEGRSKDSRLFFFHRQASDGYDLEDRAQRKKAVEEASGPVVSWSSIDEITDQFEDPTVDRTYWERVWLNRPVKSADRAFDIETWKRRAMPDYRPKDGVGVTLGFDGAQTDDSTALIACEIATGFVFPLGIWERPPGEKDWRVPEERVDEAVADAYARYQVPRFYGDPFYWGNWFNVWAGRHGASVVVWPTNKYRKMADAVRAFNNAMQDEPVELEPLEPEAPGDVAPAKAAENLARRLSHSGDKNLARHIGNAHKMLLNFRDRKGERLWVISKDRPDSPQKMDAAVAAVLCWEARRDAIAAGEGMKKKSVYERRGPIIIGGPTA